jgi:WD40 repeat protein
LSQYESIIVWDVKTGQELRSLDEHTAWIMSMAWSPDGSILASGCEDGEIILWDASSGKKLRSFHEPKGWVDNLTWSPDGKQLASGAHNRITVRDVQTGEQLRAWSVDTLTLTNLAWSPDGSRLASLSYDGTGIIWEASSGKQLQSLPANRFSEALVWSPGGELLSTSHPLTEAQQQVTLWNPQTGEAVRSQPGVYNLAWSPRGDIVASISDQGTGYLRDDTTLILWDPQTGAEVRRFNTGLFLTNIGWSPDGDFLIIGADENASLIVLDARTGEELHRLKGHYDFVSEAAWSPRGDRIASASYDGTVMIWEMDGH